MVERLVYTEKVAGSIPAGTIFVKMDYKNFKETDTYKSFPHFMKLAIGMYFLDSSGKGLSVSELENKLKGELSKKEISLGINMLLDNLDIEKACEKKEKNYYKLDLIFYGTLRLILFPEEFSED